MSLKLTTDRHFSPQEDYNKCVSFNDGRGRARGVEMKTQREKKSISVRKTDGQTLRVFPGR